jgi:cell division septation protein DedD
MRLCSRILRKVRLALRWKVSERIFFGCNLAMNFGEQLNNKSMHSGRALTMLDGDRGKRHLRDIWLQVAVSTFVLLGPLLAMAAGVKYFASSLPRVPAPLQAFRPQATTPQLAGLALARSDTRAERADIRMERSGIRRDDAAVTLIDTEQRPLDMTASLSMAGVEATTATADVSAKGLEQVPVPKRRISSLTRSGTAPQRVEAALTPLSQPFAAVPPDLPTKPARLAAGSNETKSWVVQLAAQRTEAEAQSAFRAAQTKYSMLAGYQLVVRKKEQGERGVFYAAQLGPLSRDEANQLCSKLKNAGGNCFIQGN